MDNGDGAGVAVVILFAVFALLGLIPAGIASSKGRDFITWWVYGTMLFLIALIHSFFLKPTRDIADRKAAASGMVKCPQCAEMIRSEAKICRYCGSDVTQKEAKPDWGKKLLS